MLFLVYLFNKRLQWLSWQTLSAFTSKTWVRAPGLHVFNIILPLTFTCRFSLEAHHTRSKNQRPSVQVHQIKGVDWRNSIRSSQRYSILPGKSNGPCLLGQNLHGLYLQIRGFTPLGFTIFFLFFCFFLLFLYSFNCCFYFN